MPKDVEDVFHAGIGGHRRVADGDTYLAAGGYVGDRYLQCEGFGIIPAIRIDGCAVGLYGYVAVGNASEQEMGVRMFFWTVRRPVQDFCGIARGSSSPVTS